MTSLRRGNRKIFAPRKGLISADNDVDFEDTWHTLASSLREMHTKNASRLSFEAIYRHAYKLVLKKKGGPLYERIQIFERLWLTDEVRKSLKKLLSPSLLGTSQKDAGAHMANERRGAGERFMQGVKEAFEDHQLVMNMATDVFMYLDRTYCKENHRPSIYSSAMLLFRDCILCLSEASAPSILAVLKMIMLEQIGMDRNGDPVDKTLIKSCVYMLEGLYESPKEMEEERLYLKSFEQDFLSASQDFYEAEGMRLLREADAASYCRHTANRIREETDRCRSTLSESTIPKIIAVLESTLIKGKIRELITMESGVKHMVDNDKYQDLELVFELNLRIDPKKTELTQAIQRRVQEVGIQINDAATNAAQGPQQQQPTENDQENRDRPKPGADKAVNLQTVAAIQWVDAILQLKDKYDRLWKVSLQSDPIIQPALTQSFTESINMFSRSSEYISLFIDENMKKGLKDKTEAEVDQVLDKAIVLLRYISDKDMFERYYKKHLCKRLLMGKSLSVENEREMIRKMKIELGNSFVLKLEAMFKDMQLSEELSAGYRARSANTGEAKRIDLGISVLTSMTWPLETMQSSSSESEGRKQCIFPAAIERVMKGFENFYGERYSGRRLTWMPHMGTADLRSVFPAVPGKEGAQGKERRHEINVSTYAMLVLMLFNDLPAGASLTVDEIQNRTNIGTNDLIRNLQSLAVAPKTRILLKEPMSKDVKNTDRFTFNEKFTSNFLKIRVGVVAGGGNKVEGERERKETERKNNDSRGFAIEAAVVRIMKQRKELSHQQLVSETLSQLSSQFRPDVSMIKKRIESLIDREYLERVDDSSNYRYLA